MDYTEIIQSASDKYYKSVGFGKLPTEVYIDGIKSDISKQITEIEKLTALITNNKGVLQFDMPEASKEGIGSVIEAQTKLRDKLINELKLK